MDKIRNKVKQGGSNYHQSIAPSNKIWSQDMQPRSGMLNVDDRVNEVEVSVQSPELPRSPIGSVHKSRSISEWKAQSDMNSKKQNPKEDTGSSYISSFKESEILELEDHTARTPVTNLQKKPSFPSEESGNAPSEDIRRNPPKEVDIFESATSKLVKPVIGGEDCGVEKRPEPKLKIEVSKPATSKLPVPFKINKTIPTSSKPEKPAYSFKMVTSTSTNSKQSDKSNLRITVPKKTVRRTMTIHE